MLETLIKCVFFVLGSLGVFRALAMIYLLGSKASKCNTCFVAMVESSAKKNM